MLKASTMLKRLKNKLSRFFRFGRNYPRITEFHVSRGPHPLNAPGDFYVEDGCCTMCEMPFEVAADLFGTTETPYWHCYVKKQPSSESEIASMIDAISCADLKCIRYRGKDAKILVSLESVNELDVCDFPNG